MALVEQLNGDPAVNGILVQLPLPPQIDPAVVIATIDPAKDVDGFHVENAGRLALRLARPGALHAAGLHDAAARHDRRPDGAAGAGARPLLHRRAADGAACCWRRTARSPSPIRAPAILPAECRRADILVAAVGRPEMVRGDWIKPGATVIDVGINRVAGAVEGKTRLVGDVNFAEAVEVAGAITPVPGGVGPMTIACLLLNTLTATCRQNGIPVPTK